ncbi:chromosome segregation protein SMC [Methanocorpusculum sp. GPch4]|uniref:chromosome segregation protein SMC n=1 Tax=Methanocorpusculum sp. GPch4 TaxID=2527877 RepID=UPI0014329952|nr:chromosome segregation protein SMC [Methanocorpusculum sp. GPch4]
MHIVQVEIDNFKSFSRKTKIPFYEGFTVISGPNGSGKSNIIDSILFVLSLSTSRNLRAEKLTDFINSMSGKNTAEVTLTFSDDTRIRRRIKRTANGYYSYYYLNEKTCSQTEILEYLGKRGIKPHGYNVVMQGDISRIMDMSDLERRRIIDEIAGVAEFDDKKEQALVELEQVRASIDREEILLASYAKQLEELADAREDAVKYQKLQAELEYLRAAKEIVRLRDLERELGLIAHSRAEQEEKRAGIRNDISLQENEKNARLEDVHEIDREISHKQGPAYMRIIGGIEAEKGNIRVAEETILRRKKEKESNLAEMNRLYLELQKNQNTLNDKIRESQTLQIDKANLAMELEVQKKTLDKAHELVSKCSRDSKGAQAELVELMRQVEAKKEERGSIVVQRDGIIERSRVRAQELEKLQREQGSLAEERSEKQAEIAALERDLLEAGKNKGLLDKQIGETERAMLGARKALEPLREEIARLTKKQMQIEAHQQVSGATDRTISAVLGMEGVFGTVSSLGKVIDSAYTLALNIAAGGRLNNVVVDSDQTAADVIRYLKDERLGRLTLLPLNKMKPQPPLSPLAGNGVVDYAINLIDFDPAYRDAFNLVFGQTVVVETLDAGRRLMGRYRMVTLEGELLERGGAMTGGSIRKDLRGFGVAVDRESADISAKLADLRNDEVDLAAAESRHRSVAEGLRAERNECDAAIVKLELKISDCNRILDKIADDELRASRLLEETERDKKETAHQVAELETRVDALSDELEVLNRRVGELRSVLNEDEFNLLTDKLQKAQSSYNDTSRRYENKLNDLAGLNLERQHFKQNVEQLTRERSALESKNAAIDTEVAGCYAAADAAKSVIAAFEAEMKAFTGEIEQLTEERNRVQRAADEAQMRIVTLQGNEERCNVQITAFDEKSASLALEMSEIKGSIKEEIVCDLSMEEILDRVATTERAVRKLGNVNMRAIEQYDEVQKRFTERTDKKETLSRERQALLDKIDSFRQMKFDAFMQAYTGINLHFQDIYSRLNDGAGHLVLDDHEDPFQGGMSFEVSPRGKEVTRLNLMSGGEKSLTTLSFIFAIQQFMPAPFYALDEVDSNLDGVNVERLSQMVRDICTKSQFVIVSHRKPMIEAADRMVGVTLRMSDKSTLVTGVKVNG